jgi:hypothetical protein
MRALLALAAATIAAVALPVSSASAADRDGAFTGIPSTSVQSGFGGGFVDGFDRGFRRDRRSIRGTDTVIVYDRDYQGDTAWRAESFNDWWHERPNRSYPAWVLRNRDCQRMWWDGAALRC